MIYSVMCSGIYCLAAAVKKKKQDYISRLATICNYSVMFHYLAS